MTIIIPAYKPDEKLLSVIDGIRKQSRARILVVNDGSGQDFDPIFRKVKDLGCTLLIHPRNQGKGAALKTAFRYLKEEGTKEEIVTADADGQHLPKDILACLEEAKKHPGALVLGERAFQGDVPARSRVGNTISRFTFRLLMGARVMDTQTGLRAFSSDLLDFLLSVEGERYEYEMQMLCMAARKKIPLRGITIETVYLEENRSSHFNPLRDALRVYGILIRASFGRLFQILCFLVSSLFAFLVDVAGYWLFFNLIFAPLFPDLKKLAFASLLISRIISSVLNYLINRKVVFQNSTNPLKTGLLYLLTVVVIFFANHWFNALFLVTFGAHEILALLAAQVICFPASFLIQKFIVFPKGEKKE